MAPLSWTLSMDPEYLSILMCPKTKGELRLATADEVQQLAQRQQAASQDADPLEAALVCETGGVAYPVRDGIPVLLADAAIAFDSTSDSSTPS